MSKYVQWNQIIWWRTGEEAKHARGDAESNVVIAERDAEDGHATNGDTDIGDEKRIDGREVGNVAGNETANCIGDANNGQEESGRFFINILETTQRKWSNSFNCVQQSIDRTHFSGGRVDDVDKRDVESQHAEDVGNAEEEEDGIFHQWEIHQAGHFFSRRFRYASAATAARFFALSSFARLHGFRDRDDTLAVGS